MILALACIVHGEVYVCSVIIYIWFLLYTGTNPRLEHTETRRIGVQSTVYI